MGPDDATNEPTSWMRRNRLAIGLVLAFALLSPVLLFGGTALWFSFREHPGFGTAALLLLVWLVIRVRRNRRAPVE